MIGYTHDAPYFEMTTTYKILIWWISKNMIQNSTPKKSNTVTEKKSKSKNKSPKISKTCTFCESGEGFLLSCDNDSCNQKAHVYCLFIDRRENTLLYETEKDESSCWNIFMSNWISQNAIECKDLLLDSDYCYKIQNSSNNDYSWRGGTVNVFCDIHTPEEMHCYCRQSGEYEGFMISCDYWGKYWPCQSFRRMVPRYLSWLLWPKATRHSRVLLR